jgi:MarR family transcriptional regulator, organic hydroperoxide resistance regulator
MNYNILEVVKKLRERCKSNDIELMNKFGLSESELLFFQTSIESDSLESSSMLKLTKLSPSRYCRVVDKLVKNGYLLREENEKDRRAINLSFTPKGNDISQKIKEEKKMCETKILEGLTLTEKEKLIESLNILIRKM